jgi:hypothetical protein
MSSTLLDLADAVAAGINAATFASVATQPDVQRVNWPTADLENMANAAVFVVPGTIDTTRVDRLKWQYDYSVNVFVGRHTPTDADADTMLELAEEILDTLREHIWHQSVTFPEGITSPMEARIEMNPDEALQERNAWRAVIVVIYRAFR